MSLITKYFQPESGSQTAAAVAGGIPEVDLGQLQAIQGEVDSHEFAIESLTATAFALESLASLAQSTISDGGLGREGAAVLAVAAQTHLTPLGLTSTVPAVESFGGVSDRISATGFAVEGLKEESMKIWNAIKQAIEKAIAAVKKWFKELFDKVPGLIKKFEAIKAKADKTTGTIENNKINVSAAVGGKLRLGKKVDTGTFAAGLTVYEKLTAQITKGGTKKIADRIEEVAKVATDAKLDDSGSIIVALGEIGVLSSTPFITSTGNGTVDPQDMRIFTKPMRDAGILDVKVSSELLGGYGIFTVEPKDKLTAPVPITKDEMKDATKAQKFAGDLLAFTEAAEVLAKGNQLLKEYNYKDVTMEDGDVETIAASTVSDLASSVIDVLENLKGNVTNVEAVNKAKTKALSDGEKLEKEVGSSDILSEDKTLRGEVKKMQKLLTNTVMGSDSVVNQITGKTVAMVSAMGSVLTQSLAEHK